LPTILEKGPPSWNGSHYFITDFMQRVLLFSVIWLIFTAGAAASWWIGAPAIACTAIVSLRLVAPVRPSWNGSLRFLAYFLAKSFLGAVDVSWRALHPALPIEPNLIEYPLKLRHKMARVFMANTVSLLPGTLSVSLQAHYLRVHVLVDRKTVLTDLETMEKKVAMMFETGLAGTP